MLANRVVAVLALTLTLSACTALNVSGPAVELNPGAIVSTAYKPDIEVGQKIQGTAQSVSILGIQIKGPSSFADGYGTVASAPFPLSLIASVNPTGRAKSGAAYEAMSSSGADLIVAPQYTIKTTKTMLGLIKTIEVSVVGYKGTIKSIQVVR